MVQLALSVLVVVLISATCSLFEAVLYSVPISHIEALVQHKRASGQLLQELREKVDAPIAAILSLNTISNTAGAAIAGAIAANVLGSTWVGLFSAFFTLTILFFSEVIPKTVGVVYARPLSEWIARPLKVLVWLFRPLIWLLGLATRAISGGATEEQISGAELIVMTKMGIRIGTIEKDEGAVIENILSLKKKMVREVMTPRTVLFALPDDITVDEARQEKSIFAHSRIPIYFNDLDNIVGIVHRQDILVAVAEDKLEMKLASLSKPVDFVFERTSLNQILKKFLDQQRHMFVVIGEFGGVSGVITLEDVLEEILGKEIVDESDQFADMRVLAERRRKELLEENSAFYPNSNENPSKE